MPILITILFSIYLLFPVGVQAKYDNDQGPINELMFKAVSSDDVNLLVNAINKGSDVNAIDKQKRSPLLIALFEQHHAAFKYLLTQGAKSNYRNQQQSVMELAAINDHKSYLTLLLAHGGNVDALNNDNSQSILFSAIDAGKIGNVITLLSAGARVDTHNSGGDTALHFSIKHNHLDIAYLLIEQGASLTALDASGDTSQMLIDEAAKNHASLDESQQQWLQKIIALAQ